MNLALTNQNNYKIKEIKRSNSNHFLNSIVKNSILDYTYEEIMISE